MTRAQQLWLQASEAATRRVYSRLKEGGIPTEQEAERIAQQQAKEEQIAPSETHVWIYYFIDAYRIAIRVANEVKAQVAQEEQIEQEYAEQSELFEEES